MYERLVGITKRALRKVIGSRCLSEKQLITVLTEVETVVNSRPLIYVDDDINSSFIITPLSFLSQSHQHFIPDFKIDTDTFEPAERISTSQQLLQMWKSGQKCLNQFWTIWCKDYLLSLVLYRAIARYRFAIARYNFLWLCYFAIQLPSGCAIVRYNFPLVVSCFSSTFSIATGSIAEKFLVLFFVCNAVQQAEHSYKV